MCSCVHYAIFNQILRELQTLNGNNPRHPTECFQPDTRHHSRLVCLLLIFNCWEISISPSAFPSHSGSCFSGVLVPELSLYIGGFTKGFSGNFRLDESPGEGSERTLRLSDSWLKWKNSEWIFNGSANAIFTNSYHSQRDSFNFTSERTPERSLEQHKFDFELAMGNWSSRCHEKLIRLWKRKSLRINWF